VAKFDFKVRIYCLLKYLYVTERPRPRAYANWGVGINPPIEFDILQKLYYMRKGDYLFSHTFCLLICRLNANATE